MTFLVTGAAGFIGSYVIRNLAAHGHAVVCADVAECDVSDENQLAGLFRDHKKIDRVVHLAYLMGAESEANPRLAMRVNALGTANIFEEACRKGVSRILFLSSESVYGRTQALYGDRPVTEDDYCAPADHILSYSLTKLLNEHLAAKYEARYGTEIVSLRASIVYGAGRKRGTTAWASDFVTLPRLGKPVVLPFPEDDQHCYIYVEDLAEQIRLLSTKPRLSHRIYNSGGLTVRASELAGLVRQVIPEAQIEFRNDAAHSPFIRLMDGTRIQAELNMPLRSMLEGIRDHAARVALD